MFTSLAFKRPLGFSKTLCTSARFRFVHALSPFVGIGSRHEKGRTLGLGWKGEAAGAQTRLGVRASDPKDLARTFSASDATSTTIKTKFDSIRTPDGLEHPIRDGSRLAWIGVGEAEWRLYLGEKGYVTLMQFQSAHTEPKTGRQTTSRVGTFELVRVNDDQQHDSTWMLAMKPSPNVDSPPYDPRDVPKIRHDSPWRFKPASLVQKRLLRNWITTSYEEGPRRTAEPCIAGGWVGGSWAEQVPLRELQAGEASDTISRVIWGRDKLVAQGVLRPWQRVYGDSDADHEARLEQSRKLEGALRKHYFA